MDFSVDRLRTLVSVVDLGTYSAAADALGLSQPAVSQQLASLERETGLRLFDRVGRRKVPTDPCLALAERARGALAGLDEVTRTVMDLRGLQRGRLSVGASTTPGVYVVPGALGTFAARYPHVELRIDIADTLEVERWLRARRVDLAVIGEYEAGDDLAVAPLQPDLLLPIWSGRSPLSGKGRSSLDRFLGQPFIARERGSSTRDVFEQWLAAKGRRLRPAMEFGSTEAIKQAVAAGLGVSVVSEATVGLELDAGLLRTGPLGGFPIRRRIDVALLAGRSPSPAAAAFLDVLMGPARAERLTRSAGSSRAPHRPFDLSES
ncbi:MAG TPA: LysR family transcriptional regulator [Actinomycetota bacterium]|nr:LysR family transcriptional regulator [Actinomycetota bacterium]